MMGLAFIGKFCSILFFLGAWWFYIPPKQGTNGKDSAVLSNGTDNSHTGNKY